MKTYLVGGAVRDQLLQHPVKDRDWVVVGATPEQMLDQGFQAVGKDFPVFLHPKTKEEFALARQERKTGSGYTGFACFFSPEVTLEDDLLRRDLTINAMALSEDGQLIDPYGGQEDLNHRLLRHVSDAFVEDPLRVLRVARFAACYAHLGFHIAPETLTLMKQIADSGELKHLTPERIWQELDKALGSDHPQVFLQTLHECDALAVLFPEIEQLFGVPQPAQWHPEIDAGIHTLMVIEQAAKLSPSREIRFAAMLHDLGKGLTPPHEWPSHKKHTHLGLEPIHTLCERIKTPAVFRDLALLVCEHHMNIHRVAELKPSTILKILNQLDVWRKPERFEQLLLCCQADQRGRTGFESTNYPQKTFWEQCYLTANAVNVQDIVASGLKGSAIREALNQQRITRIQTYKETYFPKDKA